MIVLRATTLIVLATWLAAASPSAAAATSLPSRLAAELRSAGGVSGAYVRDLDTGRMLFGWQPDTPRTPASVQKLYTTASVLLRDGAAATLPTVVTAGATPDARGVVAGDLHVVGSGDPTLSTRAIGRLAEAVAGAGVTRVRAVHGDDSTWDRRIGGPDSRFGYDRWIGGQLLALSLNRGWSGPRLQRQPAAHAAEALTAALRRRGVRVTQRGRSSATPAGAVEVARITSPPLRELVRVTNVTSDNYVAEMLLKGLGDRHGPLGSTAAGAAVARSTLGALGIAPTIVDGSGLSRANQTTPRDVVEVLDRLDDPAGDDALRASLAVAGQTGTLRRRMRGTAAAGNCRAKTGTLSQVSTLAGYCTTRDGRPVAFAILMNRVGIFAAHRAQDRMAAAIARST